MGVSKGREMIGRSVGRADREMIGHGEERYIFVGET